MLFSQVIGQPKIKQQLIRSVADGRVSHALLFLGPAGCGNLAMALAFAQYVNCENRTEDDSCGSCPSCIKSHKHIHPDIHYTFPCIKTDKPKRELCADWITEWRIFLNKGGYGSYNDWIREMDVDNKQGNISAKECSEILRRLSLKNYESPFKVVILWLPEFLEKEGNRLLKIIEEPPDNTLFLLVANDQEQILNTILSRVQIVKFNRLSDEDLIPVLQKQFQLDQQKAKKLAALSEGDYNEAMQLVETLEDANTQLIREWMGVCYRPKVKDIYAWNDKFVKMGREYQKNFFHYCLHFFREILLIEAGASSISKLTDAEFKTAEGLGSLLGVERIGYIIELFDKSIYFVERNVNPKILITYISVTLVKQFNRKQVNQRPFYEKWGV